LGPGSWWVRAKNTAGNGPWSSGMAITVSVNICTPGVFIFSFFFFFIFFPTSSCTTSPTRSASRSSRSSPTGPTPTSRAHPATPRCSTPALAEIERLNALYPSSADEPARFIVLHRERRFSTSEQCWIGWERKRGKLEQLIGLLAEGGTSPFLDLGRASAVAAATRYVVTLDSDTRLPPGRLRELVGVAAHPP
jgi:hypothetical protein